MSTAEDPSESELPGNTRAGGNSKYSSYFVISRDYCINYLPTPPVRHVVFRPRFFAAVIYSLTVIKIRSKIVDFS